LSEFERLSSKSQYEQAKKQQTNLHDKLMHFISYLVMVQTQILTHNKNDTMLEDSAIFEGQAEWFTNLVKQNQRFKDLSDKEEDEELKAKKKNDAYINPIYEKK
jgi:hypothetical protein